MQNAKYKIRNIEHAIQRWGAAAEGTARRASTPARSPKITTLLTEAPQKQGGKTF